jgi:fluoride ion exporter CrcB/FEX
MTMLTQHLPYPYWRLFLVAGVLGGNTRLSSFEWEALFAVRNESGWIGLIYMLSSVIVGCLAAWLGSEIRRSRYRIGKLTSSCLFLILQNERSWDS